MGVPIKRLNNHDWDVFCDTISYRHLRSGSHIRVRQHGRPLLILCRDRLTYRFHLALGETRQSPHTDMVTPKR